MKKFFLLVTFSLLSFSAFSAKDNLIHVWPSVPFVRGADLCAYNQAYSKTRIEYMREMSGLASDLMNSGAKGLEALNMLVTFDRLYDKNLALATQGNYLDITLENTLRGFLDQLYRTIKPREKRLIFSHVENIGSIIAAAKAGRSPQRLPVDAFKYLDFISYGSYAFAPNCQGEIEVTLTLVGRNGDTENFIAIGVPAVVMRQIAEQLFEKFQRTQFPSTLRIGQKQLTIIGGLNGDVDIVNDLEVARYACETQDARLPNPKELDLINAYGDWSGGVSLKRLVWVVETEPGAPLKVFHPDLRNPTPVRERWEVNDKAFHYFCVR